MDLLKKLSDRARKAMAGEGVPPSGSTVSASPITEPPSSPRASPPPPIASSPHGFNHFLLIVLDSLRWDTFLEARPRWIPKLGEVERRFSYASWTAPSHYNLMMGLLPHSSPKAVYASEYYKDDFRKYDERLGASGIEFRRFVPDLYLPTFLRNTLGYRTSALVSMPVLNPRTPLNRDFDHFELMPRHNDMKAMLERLHFPEDRPSFHLLNVGETHYPYALPGEPEGLWPKIHGVHGVWKHLGAGGDAEAGEKFFDPIKMVALRQRQVETVRYLDGLFEELFDRVPPRTWVTVTSDHGELFGEGGYFGHGPILHEKVLEVPFVEGRIR